MIDKQKLKKLAKVIVNYSLEVRAGERVLIRGYGFEGLPLIKEIYRECIRAGALEAVVRFSHDELSRIFFEEASEEQLVYLDELEKKMAESYDAMVQIIADENPYELAGVDAKKLQKVQKSRKPLSDIFHQKKWCLFYYPNLASASLAKKSLEKWQEFVLDSCLLDWPKVEKLENKFIELMEGVGRIRIEGEETDLRLSVGGQKWRACCGRRNLPDGEIFTGPVRTSVDGVIKYNVPSQYNAQDFEWVKLWIEKGKVVKEDSNNKKALSEILNADEGARYFGEFAFGLNETITVPTRQILFDEKMARSLHMALGKCYKECPNGNDSSIHWDLIFRFDWSRAVLWFDEVKVFEKNKWVDKRFEFLNKGI